MSLRLQRVEHRRAPAGGQRLQVRPGGAVALSRAEWLLPLVNVDASSGQRVLELARIHICRWQLRATASFPLGGDARFGARWVFHVASTLDSAGRVQAVELVLTDPPTAMR